MVSEYVLTLTHTTEKELHQRDQKIEWLETENQELKTEVQTMHLSLVEGRTLYEHAVHRLQDHNTSNTQTNEIIARLN